MLLCDALKTLENEAQKSETGNHRENETRAKEWSTLVAVSQTIDGTARGVLVGKKACRERFCLRSRPAQVDSAVQTARDMLYQDPTGCAINSLADGNTRRPAPDPGQA